MGAGDVVDDDGGGAYLRSVHVGPFPGPKTDKLFELRSAAVTRRGAHVHAKSAPAGGGGGGGGARGPKPIQNGSLDLS